MTKLSIYKLRNPDDWSPKLLNARIRSSSGGRGSYPAGPVLLEDGMEGGALRWAPRSLQANMYRISTHRLRKCRSTFLLYSTQLLLLLSRRPTKTAAAHSPSRRPSLPPCTERARSVAECSAKLWRGSQSSKQKWRGICLEWAGTPFSLITSAGGTESCRRAFRDVTGLVIWRKRPA
jgi:hypothetical protein